MDDLEARLQKSLERHLDDVPAFPLASDRMRRARRLRAVGATLGLFAVLAVAGSAVVIGTRWADRGADPADGAGEYKAGFAVWPEDNVGAAAAACDRRAAGEPWRRGAAETAMRFVAEELGWPDPTLYSDGPEDSPTTLIVGDSSVKGVFLGVAVTLFEFDGCWFVREVVPREGDVPMTTAFVEVDGKTQLLIMSQFNSPLEVEVGFGAVERFTLAPGEQTAVAVHDPSLTGHYLAYVPDQPSMNVRAGALPVPLTPVQEPSLVRIGGYALGPFTNPDQAVRMCDEPRRPALHDPELLIRNYFRREVDAAVDRIERASARVWEVEVESARLKVTVLEAVDGCWGLRSIEPFDGASIVTTLDAVHDRITLRTAWQRGRTAQAYIALGGSVRTFRIPNVDGSVTIPVGELGYALRPDASDDDRLGWYLVVLYDERGRIAGVQAAPLQPS